MISSWIGILSAPAVIGLSRFSKHNSPERALVHENISASIIDFHRPYRPALGREVAHKEVIANKGRFYDSDVVDTCVALKDFSFG